MSITNSKNYREFYCGALMIENKSLSPADFKLPFTIAADLFSGAFPTGYEAFPLNSTNGGGIGEWALLISERCQRIDQRRAPRRDVTGNHGDSHQQKADAGDGDGVGWPDAEQEVL